MDGYETPSACSHVADSSKGEERLHVYEHGIPLGPGFAWPGCMGRDRLFDLGSIDASLPRCLIIVA